MKNFLKQKFIISVGGLFVCLLALVGVSSCEKDEGPTISLDNYGRNFTCVCVNPEKVYSNHNCYIAEKVDTISADLALQVGGTTSSETLTLRDSLVEERILQNIDPMSERGGTKYTSIFYTTRVCTSIKISVYDKDSVFVADVTDKARFYYYESEDDDYIQMLINSDKYVLGEMQMGMTIDEYLECEPFLFVNAHFIFDGLTKDDMKGGKYFKTEIILDDNTVLVSHSEGHDI